jgi:UDP-N-acetylmuramoyl-tripeptide--D-alanyl-D-alanine ligase
MIYGLRQLFSQRSYPKWLVLEVGLEYPGEIKSVLKWVNFDATVVTLLPEVPVHVEFFSSKDEVIKEKMLLAQAVPLGGLVFLNADDANALKFLPEIKAEVFTYGRALTADYRSGLDDIYYHEEDKQVLPAGLEFKLFHNEKDLVVRIPGVIGSHQIYPVLSALAVGEKLGLNMVEMIDSFANYLPPPGRLRLIEGIKGVVILDDTYNASPAAMSAGLSALQNFVTNGRKIAVLGDMMQLGALTAEAHKKIGYQAGDICDLVITVGLRAKFIDSALLEKKYSIKRIKHFNDSVSAGRFLQDHLKKGDLIFVKGSQSVRMEKVVEEIMAHPEQKDKLLVRQDKEWQKR